MQLNLKLESIVPKECETFNGDTFTLMITRPTYQERLREMGFRAIGDHTAVAGMIIGKITNWDGVNDLEGNPILFTQDNLQAAIAADDAFAMAAAKAAQEVYYETLDQGQRKNLKVPSES